MVNLRSAKVYVILVAVFLLGAVAGGAGVFAVVQRRHAALIHGGSAVDAERLHALARRLDLDAQQREAIGAVLHDARREARDIIWDTDRQCGHRLRDHRAEVDDRIRSTLRPDQRARFDRMLEERERRDEGNRDASP